MADLNPAADSPSARERFLALYKADLLAGRSHSLADYQARFPGHEASIADEWRWLEPESVAGGAGAAQQPARRIGPYRVIEELGHGAQATVYLAAHETLHRRVALKVMRAPVTDGSSQSEQRFRREAEVMASLEHPNLCSVYETGDSDGATWIAMQYVPGATLAAYLARHRDDHDQSATLQLPESDAGSESGNKTAGSGAGRRSDLMRVVQFAEQAARALHVAHEHGLVHRDIKPGNLMVADDGRPVILDFGLARTSGRDGSLGGLGLTRSADVLGTPYYMAPEQLRAGAGVVDPRTDVYALGVTLFECLTGRRPFDAVSLEALYQQILTVEAPAPRTLNPQIPTDLEVVVQTAIEKERGRRYQSALDFAEDLRRVRLYEPIHARPISTWGRVVRLARRHPGVAASLSIAAVSLVVGLVVSLLFLQEANQALAAKNQALAAKHQAIVDQYHDTSKAAARADVHGEITEMKSRLRRMAEVVVAAEDPGLANRIRAMEEAIRQTRGPTPAISDRIEVLYRDARPLSAAGRAAVADLLHAWMRSHLFVSPLDSALMSELIDRVELQHEILSEPRERALPDTDVRVVRARIMLLDVLNRTRNFDRAKHHAESWLVDRDSSAPGDGLRVALYESRLGRSLLGLGKPQEARQVLQRSVPTVVDGYPRAWYGNVAMANLLTCEDDAGGDSAPEAAQLRQKLMRSVIETSDHGELKHNSVDLIRLAFGRSRQEFLNWGHQWGQAHKPLSESDVGRLEHETRALQEKLGIEDRDPEICVLAVLCRDLAGRSASFLGSWHPVVGRLSRLSLVHVEKAPRANYVYEASARVQRGDHLVGRGAYAAAERSFRRASELLPTVLLRAQFEGPLGSCLAATGQFEDAEWRLTRAFDVAVEWYGPWRNETMRHVDDLVLLYRMWGRLDAAKAWHRRSIEERRRPADHLFLAETLWQFGRLAQARATIEQAPAAGAKGLLHLANLTLLEGQLDQAIRNAEQASKLADGLAAKRRWMPSREIQVGAQRVWAQALLARGDARAALPHFELGAADPRPDGDGFFSDYGKALVAVGPGADAGRARMAQLTREREEDPLAWHARARFLATTEGLTGQDRKQAVQCAQRASELCRGRRAFVLATLAEAQFQAGDAEAALETAAAVETLMAGRDAQWLSVEQAAARFQAYR